MKIKGLREAIKGEGVRDLFVEFDGVLYEVRDIRLRERLDRAGPDAILVVERFDEIDQSGTMGDDIQ